MNSIARDTNTLRDRAHGALLGLAIGDALGMPTQGQSPAWVAARYGVLDGFHPGPEDNQVSRGMAAGRVTDDTDQAVILGRMLCEGEGRVDPSGFARALLAWERRMEAAGSADLLGPSSRQALALVSAGASTDETGRHGATNGAAMRVAPVGIAFPPEPLERLVGAVFQTGHVTHNTNLAMAGASAVAACVSAGLDGATLDESLALAVAAARLGARHGFYAAGADVAARIEWALGLMAGRDAESGLDLIARLVGTGMASNESIPAALAVCALAPGDPFLACRLAASLGGDCDTIAAMTGAMMGARHGASGFPSAVAAALCRANPELDLPGLADGLLALRRRAS